ncbi:MAG TPA: hypothetical protein ENI09_01345 [candidate division WWE3 bacterium]|uniref:Uncharacterized protein n=1 Tax=candidate division WWE3 bacterium TaxID=2053526 RepID=A0A7C1SQG9_UNCKA|nr:hypothetical protein [candidate division WWE3 bacterium]
MRRRQILQGETLKILEGSVAEAASRLGISQTAVRQGRKGLVKPTTKTAKALTTKKFTHLLRRRGHRLTAKQRQALEMVYGLGHSEPMTVRAVAARLRISPVAVSDHVGRARLKLLGWPNREKVKALSASSAWDRLTTLQKRLLTLRYGLEAGLEPQSYGEISQSMGRSENWGYQATVFSLNKLIFDE